MLDKNNEIYYSYDDVFIMPTTTSFISSRTECNARREDDGMYPIFTAPMDSVVGVENESRYHELGIHPILPRTVELEIRLKYALSGKWAAFSLSEFSAHFSEGNSIVSGKAKALIDVANGHMEKIQDLVRRAKSHYGSSLEVMVGNIANPESIIPLSRCGADYVRVGIGGGLGCITSTQTGIHCPPATLLDKMAQLKDDMNCDGEHTAKIIADGGIRCYADVIKALSLGADYVMIGGLFSSLIGSSGEYVAVDSQNNRTIGSIRPARNEAYEIINDWIEKGLTVKKVFYGMASAKGQVAMNGIKTKTSEGTSKILTVTDDLDGWIDNLDSYLRSAMSYVGIKKVEDLYKRSICIITSKSGKDRINS